MHADPSLRSARQSPGDYGVLAAEGIRSLGYFRVMVKSRSPLSTCTKGDGDDLMTPSWTDG